VAGQVDGAVFGCGPGVRGDTDRRWSWAGPHAVAGRGCTRCWDDE